MARPKKYMVTLTEEQRTSLQSLLRKGTAPARVLTRARILLLAAEGRSHRRIAQVLQVSPSTVIHICRRFVQQGPQGALCDRPRPGGKRKLDARGEATLIALACSDPPEGRGCWTLQLLGDKLVELGVVERISDETVRRVLKKTASSPGKRSTGAWAR